MPKVRLPSPQELRTRYATDMAAFGKGVSPGAFFCPTPPFHRQIYSDFLDPAKRYLCYEAPRDHAKTTVCGKIASLHHLMHGKTETGRKVIPLTSQSQAHARRTLAGIKDVLEYSPVFRYVYGYWGEHSAKKWTDAEVILKDGSAIVALGTRQQVLGIKYGDQRPTYFVLDDPEDDNNTRTPDSMEKNFAWLLKEARPSLAPSGKMVIIGTPVKQNCIVERLRDSSLFFHRHYSAELDPERKISLWPEKISWAQLMALKDELTHLGRYSYYASNYLCVVTGDEEQPFKPENWRFYKLIELEYKDGLHYLRCIRETLDKGETLVPVLVYMGVDPASSIAKYASYSAITPVAVDVDYNRYTLPYYKKRVSPMELANEIIRYARKNHPYSTRIESVGYQDMLRDYLRSRTDIRIPGLESKVLPHGQSKDDRLLSMQPWHHQGKIWITREMKEFKEDFELFPGTYHKDVMDAYYYATRKMHRPTHVVEDYDNRNPSRHKVQLETDWRVL